MLHDAPTYTGDRQDDCAATYGPTTPPHEPSSRNDARRNAIGEALQPLLAIARTLKTGSDGEG